MDLEWDDCYYQPQSDNEWLIQEQIDNDVIIKRESEINNESYL